MRHDRLPRFPLLAGLAAGLGAATPAAAHPGHLTDLAGHNHWVAGAAIGAAVVIGALAALKGWRKGGEPKCDQDGADEDTETGDTRQEA